MISKHLYTYKAVHTSDSVYVLEAFHVDNAHRNGFIEYEICAYRLTYQIIIIKYN